MGSSAPICIDDELFVGPVTQHELIITWKKRRQFKLEMESKQSLLKNECEEEANGDINPLEKLTLYQESLLSRHNQSSDGAHNEDSDDYESAEESLHEVSAPGATEDTNFEDDFSNNKEDDLEPKLERVSVDSDHSQLEINSISSKSPLMNSVDTSCLSCTNNSRPNTFLRPPKLKFDSVLTNTEWTRRINMKKIVQPSKPLYVQSLQSYNKM